MIPRDRPFVLLDDAGADDRGTARLFADPHDVLVAGTAAEVAPALDRLRAALAGGAHAAGYVGYEAGHALEPRLRPRDAAPGAPPLLWFGLFDAPARFPARDLPQRLPDPAGGWAGSPTPLVDEAAHAAAMGRVLGWIGAGDIYQANLTLPLHVPVAGDPLSLYAQLRARARAPWGGVLFTGAHWLLSFSPELFFTLERGAITARPMKGTAPATADPAALAHDPKQRAENLMIVDLLRNDLARVAVPGSVRVPARFTVERYPTLLQMTSTITARLAPGHDAVDLLAATFPCGSVTGAPKIRAMELIDAVESGPRGPYTGAIGWLGPQEALDPAGDGAFNVAIRTLLIEEGATHGRLGVGSGIVADSVAADEWRECLAKAAFVSAPGPAFDLIETMRFDAIDGIVDLDRHLLRMKASAQRFGFRFNRHDARNELQAATFRLRDDARLRLLLSPSGAVAIAVDALPPPPTAPVRVAVVPLPVAPADLRLRNKTSDRDFYDEARRAAGTFEVIFADPDGFLTEGSFTSLFVRRDGRLLTPPLARGLLAGVLRGRLIDDAQAVEADLTVADLRDGFLLGNAVRGLIDARLVADGDGATL